MTILTSSPSFAAAESARSDMYLNSMHELLCMMLSRVADTNDNDDARRFHS
jgi:hypothetical protein